MSSQNQQLPAYWINIMERDDWLVINLEGRKMGLIMSVTEGGLLYLTVAGYHSGESRFIGEKRNVLAVKVEPIPKEMQGAFLTLVSDALPPQLRAMPTTFLQLN